MTAKKLLLPVLLGLLFYILLFRFPSVAAAASLSLSPATATQNVGDTFAVDIVLDTEGTAASGATAILNYDTVKLQVVDDDAGTIGVQIKAGPNLTQTLTNTVDTTNGQINYSAGNLGSTFNNRGTMATIHFKAIAAGVAQVSFAFNTSSTTNTSLVSQAGSPTNLLTTVSEGSYTINAVNAVGSKGVTSSASLPKTGVVEDTLMVLVGGGAFLGLGLFLARKALV